MDSAPLRSALIRLLAEYLEGEATLEDVRRWEAEYSLDESVPEDLRGVMDRLALLAEEVADGIRSEQELRKAAIQEVNPTIDIDVPAYDEQPVAETSSSSGAVNISRRVRDVVSETITRELSPAVGR